MTSLVLSLFPGIGLLDMAFEEEGFCVVRGPDLLWGGDVRRFHVPAGKFAGVIGGPPCKAFSALVNINIAQGREPAPNLIPEFERIVGEARPEWFVMENVLGAPAPDIEGYDLQSILLNNRWCPDEDGHGGEQNRLRRFSYSLPNKARLLVNLAAMERPEWQPAVTSTSGGRRAVAVRDENGRVRGKQGDASRHRLRGRTVAEMCRLQGLPLDFLDRAPFTVQGKREMIGNGVPLPMGRAVARAVKAALGMQEMKSAA